MIRASAVLIAKNEENRLRETLVALRDFEEVIVVDSESQDQTREIAQSFGAKVFVRPFDNFANQKNFGIEKASKDWIFSVDADERPNEELLNAAKKVAENGVRGEAGYSVKVRNFHFGKELRWGGQGSDWHVRLFRKNQGRFVSGIHEYVQVEGKTGRLAGALLHDSIRTVTDYMKKLSFYTGLEVKARKESGRKESLLWRGTVKPFLRFIYFYIFRLGFLDGFEGFLFHALSSFYLTATEAQLAHARDHAK